MRVRGLRDRLDGLDPDDEIMCLAGPNGGGVPREINLGPCERIIAETDAGMTADCEGLVGRTIQVIGYGCY